MYRGVAVDDQGYIAVADSGNNRIQVFTADGVFVKAFGCWGSGDGEFKVNVKSYIYTPIFWTLVKFDVTRALFVPLFSLYCFDDAFFSYSGPFSTSNEGFLFFPFFFLLLVPFILNERRRTLR